MIERLIKQFTDHMAIEQDIDPEAGVMFVRTWFGDRLIHEEETDLVPLFEAYDRWKDR